MKKYSTSAVSSFIESATAQGYDLVQVEEGTLGHGHLFMLSPRSDWYNFEVLEVATNSWSSAHTVRRFSKISARISRLLAMEVY